MIRRINPTSFLKGNVRLPASKSYSIRAFIIAACGGKSRILSPSNCDDAKVSMSVAGRLGSKIVALSGRDFLVHAKSREPALREINVKESGTVLRFLLPILALYGRKCRVVGEGTLRGRPNHFLTKVLRQQGIKVNGKGPQESVPICFTGGLYKGGKIIIDGTLSSQFISALLIACPNLDKDTQINVAGKRLVSSDYITMTLNILKKAGVKVTASGSRTYRIKGNQKFKGLGKFAVPSDYGLAAFLMAAGILVPSKISLAGNINDGLLQADGRILRILSKMGAKFIKNSKGLKLSGPFVLKGGEFSLKDCPDLLPIMSVMALFAKGKTRLYNIKHARVKESDRISDLRKELLKVGADIREKENELIIVPKEKYKGNVLLNPHHDHRLAMAFCVLGLKIGARVRDISCISKSYPDFIRDLKQLGVMTGR